MDAQPHESSERGLLESAAQGQRDAFETLYRLHHGAVLAACRRWIGDPLLAEELTQEVFVKAYRHLPSLRHATTMRPWLIAVARNLCIDHSRTSRMREVELEDALTASGSFDVTSERAIAHVSLQRLWKRVHPELARLDARDRRLLWQRDVEGRSYREIAHTEGETKHALRNRAFRARMLIRERVHLLREELDALSAFPPLALLQRIQRRVRERAGRVHQGFAGVSFPALSLSGCLSVVLSIGAPVHGMRPIDGAPIAQTSRVFAADARATPSERLEKVIARTSPQRHATQREPIDVSVETKRRPGSAAPEDTRSDVNGVIGEVSIDFFVHVDCGAGDSDVLPLTGQYTTYC